MTVAEYSDRLNELYGVVGNIAEYTVAPGAAEMLASIKRRVVLEGKGTSGNNIGSYSQEPIYAERSQFVKKGAFQPRGINYSGSVTVGDKLRKSGKDDEGGIKYRVVKDNNKARKTMYLPNGYKELRDVQGFETGFMNLKYSGKLVKDYQMQMVDDGALLGITTNRSAEIYGGLTGRFGAFYPPSTEEKKQYFDSTTVRINRIIRGTIQGEQLIPTVSIAQ